jgi:deazaflavin-dependent oxidoreductase (nitroreductase family)
MVARGRSSAGRADRYRWLWRISNRLESTALRYLGTSGIALIGRRTVLVLETTGRKTGRTRRTPVAYWRDGNDALFIGGGAGGMSRVDWVANLREDPAAAVWIGRRRQPVIGTELSGDDYEQARRRASAHWPDVARYERTSGRPIPYFRLDRPETSTGVPITAISGSGVSSGPLERVAGIHGEHDALRRGAHRANSARTLVEKPRRCARAAARAASPSPRTIAATTSAWSHASNGWSTTRRRP